LKKLPEKPGVYIMKNTEGEIIYVGKAVNLKNRVRQYFQSLSGQTQKVRLMVPQISTFEYIITSSEMEALILECNLIKRYKPKFNILLKDDKTYPYIKVTVNEEYPRVFMTRKVEKDGARYFGPYTSVSDVRETISFLKKTFPIKNCKKKLPDDIGKGRPCLNYYIQQCMAPCQGWVSNGKYKEIINDICSFLSGKEDELLGKLQKEMSDASENMEFERAAAIRNKIISLKNMFQEQKVVSESPDDEDVIALARNEEFACVQIFFIRNGKLIGRESFIFTNIEESNSELMESFIKQFYSSSEYIPKYILLQVDIYEKELFENWLQEKRGSKVHIRVPRKGEKLKLVKMVSQNAQTYLNNYVQTGEDQKKPYLIALDELAKLMGTVKIPARIEAYDISNTGSTEITGSMVVFEDGISSPKQYRRFKIKSLNQPDDYEAMQEMIFRRFRRGRLERVDDKDHTGMENEENSIKVTQSSVEKYAKPSDGFSIYPDLILVDGGIGHVNAIIEVLEHSGLQIPVYGMVKDEKHRTRGLILPGKEINLSTNQILLKFITEIQNEAHRFALEYNKKLRNKRYTKSVLDDIPGIGSGRKKDLIRHFGSVDKIRRAEVDDLMDVRGINKTLAINIYEFFRRGK